MKSTRLLTLVAPSNALICAGCAGSAYTLADLDKSSSPEHISREIPWDGAEALTLDIPAVLQYVQAPGPGKLVASGPQRSVSTITVTEGRIHDQQLRSGAALKITVTAPSVTSFYLNGRSRLTIEAYDQNRLSLTTQGAAAVEVAGRALAVDVAMQGSGSIDLTRLTTDSLTASIGGTTELVAKPGRAANLEVRNLASTVLLSHPPELTTKLVDSGRVIHASPGAQ